MPDKPPKLAGDTPVLTVKVGDIVSLRKPHPCGSRRWRVRRVGADVGLVCEGCGRRVLMPRRELRRRLGRIEAPATEA